MRGLWFFVALLLAPLSAQAQPVSVFSQGAANTSTYTGPGDIVSGAAAWYSVTRAYNRSYATSLGAAYDWTCTNGSTFTGTVHVTSSGGLNSTDTGTISSDCSSATVSYTKLYDQTGNGNHVTQATGSKQPTRVTNCINTSLDCARATASGVTNMVTAGNVSVSSPITEVVLGQSVTHDTSNNQMFLGGSGTPSIRTFGSNANFIFYNTSGGSTSDTSIADGSFHAIIACLDASNNCNSDGSHSGVISGDGTTSTGTSSDTQSTPFNFFSLVSGGSGVLEETEGGIWGVAFSSTQFTNMCHNMRLYYGTGGSC